MMPGFDSMVRKFTNILCLIAVAMLALMTLVGLFDVIGRYFLNMPIKGSLEASEILLAGVVLFGLSYASSTESHVRIDTFIILFPSRVQVIIGGVTSFLSLIIFFLIGWQGTELALQSWQRHRLVDIFLIPIAPFQLFASLGALAVCLELIVQIRRFINAARRET